ncbi:MAG: transglycosylase SLT domain-containing protein [Thermodesulfobacteriota bacterium]
MLRAVTREGMRASGSAVRKARSAQAQRRRRRKRSAFPPLSYRIGEHALTAALAAAAGLAILGRVALGGAPWAFAAALAGVMLVGAAAILPLDRLRRRASPSWRHALNVALLALLAITVWHSRPGWALYALRELLAGERATQVRVVQHQVFAAYRRMDLDAQRKILERAEVYAPTIEQAAAAFAVDPELMMGIAAAESSFYPRDSRDGGKGLFQITSVPAAAVAAARDKLGVKSLDPWNQRHNAYVAAATLDLYRKQMRGDLFLTLLAYNIGPHNGGLRTIMDAYGARNFAQVQPYLQTLPRDYPIRVLSSALAYRVWRRLRRLPRFEEGTAAREIQSLGIPGLEDALQPALETAEASAARR